MSLVTRRFKSMAPRRRVIGKTAAHAIAKDFAFTRSAPRRRRAGDRCDCQPRCIADLAPTPNSYHRSGPASAPILKCDVLTTPDVVPTRRRRPTCDIASTPDAIPTRRRRRKCYIASTPDVVPTRRRRPKCDITSTIDAFPMPRRCRVILATKATRHWRFKKNA